jgi:hypothetical protein
VTSHMLTLVPGACAAPGVAPRRPGALGRDAGRSRYGHRTVITAAARPGCGTGLWNVEHGGHAAPRVLEALSRQPAIAGR